jgi:hypothetical protein
LQEVREEAAAAAVGALAAAPDALWLPLAAAVAPLLEVSPPVLSLADMQQLLLRLQVGHTFFGCLSLGPPRPICTLWRTEAFAGVLAEPMNPAPAVVCRVSDQQCIQHCACNQQLARTRYICDQ